MSRFLKITTAMVLLGSPVFADGFGLGREALPEEIAAWNKDVRPDGTGLPVGSGDVMTGDDVFADKCASCHGDFAEGVGNWPKLAGGWNTLDRENPVKTVGSYWPYLSTTWDYISRSMPFGDAQSLEPDEVYAIVAYILYSNDLVEDDFVLSNENFADLEMPNKDGFIIDDRIETEFSRWVGEPCMESCKEDVKVTMRAMVLDVTPGVAGDTADSAETANEAAKEETATMDAKLIAIGENVFKKCKACHQVGEGAKNRIGPVLTGIVGQPAGSVEGFKYSPALMAMAEDGLVWDETNLKVFLANPRGFMKGTKMSFAGLKKDDELIAITAYLENATE